MYFRANNVEILVWTHFTKTKNYARVAKCKN